MDKFLLAILGIIVIGAIFLSKTNVVDINKSIPNKGTKTVTEDQRPFIQRKNITFTATGRPYSGDPEERFLLAGKDKDLAGKIIGPIGRTMDPVGTIDIDGVTHEVWRCHVDCTRGQQQCHKDLPIQYLYVRKNTDSYIMDVFLAENYFTDPPTTASEGYPLLYDDVAATTVEMIPDFIPVSDLNIDLTLFIDGKETNYALAKDASGNPIKQQISKELIDLYMETPPIGEDKDVPDLGTLSIYRLKTGLDNNSVYGLKNTTTIPDGQSHEFYVFNKIVAAGAGGRTENVTKNSLQLGYFTFVKKAEFSSTGYPWWQPDCKPAIYLYPKTTTPVSVAVEPKGFLTVTIPTYGQTGWHVIAHSNGSIIDDGGRYPYLYYEAKIEDSAFQKPTDGYVVSKDELPGLFEKLLPRLGLQTGEKKDFIAYWEKALPKSPYYFVGILSEDQTNAIEPLTITPKPDTIIRVRLYFEPLSSRVIVSEPKATLTPERTGFSVVEWGGMVKTDKEHPYTCSQ